MHFKVHKHSNISKVMLSSFFYEITTFALVVIAFIGKCYFGDSIMIYDADYYSGSEVLN